MKNRTKELEKAYKELVLAKTLPAWRKALARLGGLSGKGSPRKIAAARRGGIACALKRWNKRSTKHVPTDKRGTD